MNGDLTTSKVEDNKFHLGQVELSMVIKRILRHYRYHNKNQNPDEVVMPLLKEVEGVPITYEQTTDRPTDEPRPSELGNTHSQGDSQV